MADLGFWAIAAEEPEHLALVEAATGNSSAARDHLRLVLEHDPDSKEAHALLSRLGAAPERP